MKTKKDKKIEIFVASDMPFPYWWGRDDITLYGEDIKKADEYMQQMNLIQFVRNGRDFTPIYESQSHLRIWDFKFIAKE